MAMAEGYEGTSVFGNNESYIKLRVDSGEYEHHLERRADYGNDYTVGRPKRDNYGREL